MFLIGSSDIVWSAFPLFVAVLLIVFVVQVYRRQGRNNVLECALMEATRGQPETFEGTLSVIQHRPGKYLRLAKGTEQNRRLQFQYRWLTGNGPQANFDEVTFDGEAGIVDLRRGERQSTVPFSDFQAIRVREIGGKGGSLWHVELLRHGRGTVLFATSARGDRAELFQKSAPLAKAISTITQLPAHVFVAGNVWTPGWPPKDVTQNLG
jgi:hypothetical protein